MLLLFFQTSLTELFGNVKSGFMNMRVNIGGEIGAGNERSNFFILVSGARRTMLTGEEIGNELNRSLKLAIDTGEASSIDEARAIFEGYKIARASSIDDATPVSIASF